ncbi:MAG: DUF1501 domain-containing protein, partial [Phycisphaerae bacterium]
MADNRRGFFAETVTGLSQIALAALFAENGLLADVTSSGSSTVSGTAPIRPVIDPARPFAARQPQGTARANRVLMIFCSGACSHIDTFDYKPELIARHGQSMPGSETLITFQGEQGNLT